jgi:Lipopolysaccharide-assembly
MTYNHLKSVEKYNFWTNQKFRIILFILFVISLLFNFGCCTYSFTGSSVPEHLKTISIPIAEDRSGAGIPNLRESLTEELVNKFIEDNSLQVSDRSGSDAILECTVTSVSDAPTIVTAGENVSFRRVTITVNVTYKDMVKRKTVIDKSFSNYGEYEPGGTTSGRDDAITQAIDKLTEDILLAVVSGW